MKKSIVKNKRNFEFVLDKGNHISNVVIIMFPFLKMISVNVNVT